METPAEDPMDTLRNCLMERLSLRKEREVLAARELEIISPSVYLDCWAKLDSVDSRLHTLAFKIAILRGQLSANVNTCHPT
jgi:hypothetical protein